MHTFVYGSRVIENEQQIRLERHAKIVGSVVGNIVKFCVAFFLFVVLNALLSNLVQHTHLFSLNVYVNTLRFIEEATRVLFVDNAFTTTSIIYQDLLGIVAALTVIGIAEYGLMVRAFGNACEHSEGEQNDNSKREEYPQTANSLNTVSYRLKVCFLS